MKKPDDFTHVQKQSYKYMILKTTCRQKQLEKLTSEGVRSLLSAIPYPLQSLPSPENQYIPHKETRFSSNEYLMTTLIGLVPDTLPLEAPAPYLPG
jgi:hypothetical protein